MPELPEVETIARSLKKGNSEEESLIGRTISGVDLGWHKTLATPTYKEFRRRVIGQRIEDIDRRAKYLVFHLTNDYLIYHLRMSGDLFVGRGEEILASHPRLVVFFEMGLHLIFNDPRKFGRVWLLSDPQELFSNLGQEPFDPNLTAERFHAKLSSRKRQIKPLLLDQAFLAGMGNIYADESLFLAKIHPKTQSDRLTNEQSKLLLKSIRKILKDAIHRNGASIDWVYRGGEFQNDFQVYQRTDEPCLRCNTPIIRITLGQRGTHYCPSCQQEL